MMKVSKIVGLLALAAIGFYLALLNASQGGVACFTFIGGVFVTAVLCLWIPDRRADRRGQPLYGTKNLPCGHYRVVGQPEDEDLWQHYFVRDDKSNVWSVCQLEGTLPKDFSVREVRGGKQMVTLTDAPIL